MHLSGFAAVLMLGDAIPPRLFICTVSIMSKTGGNPLFVEHMAVAMKGQRYLVVSGTGELFFKPKQNPSELDALFPRDLQTAMLVQFDRLPQDLQLILRVASVIGQVHSFARLSVPRGPAIWPSLTDNPLSVRHRRGGPNRTSTWRLSPS